MSSDTFYWPHLKILAMKGRFCQSLLLKRWSVEYHRRPGCLQTEEHSSPPPAPLVFRHLSCGFVSRDKRQWWHRDYLDSSADRDVVYGGRESNWFEWQTGERSKSDYCQSFWLCFDRIKRQKVMIMAVESPLPGVDPISIWLIFTRGGTHTRTLLVASPARYKHRIQTIKFTEIETIGHRQLWKKAEIKRMILLKQWPFGGKLVRIAPCARVGAYCRGGSSSFAFVWRSSLQMSTSLFPLIMLLCDAIN